MAPSNGAGSLSDRSRVLAIGLDGACLELLTPWIEEGRLPNLSSLIHSGAYGDLASVLPPGTAQGWSSLYTGKNPGKHGIFEFSRRRMDTHDFVPINSSMRDSMDLWEILSQHGKRVGLVNLPVTYPPRKVNGFMICGLMTPSEKSSYTYPPPLKEELKAAVPGYRVNVPSISRISDSYYLKNLHLSIDMKLKAALYLMRRFDWDYFMVAFSETDIVQHWFWAHMEENSTQGEARKRSKYADAILDIYRRVDNHIGRLLQEIDDDTYLLIVSDHGAGPLLKILDTNYLLYKMGMLRLKSSFKTKMKRFLRKMLVLPFVQGTSHSNKLWWLAYPLFWPTTISVSDFDLAGTQAYSYGYGQIYVNRKGKETDGSVNPGIEYEKVVGSIINSLRNLIDPENGEKIVDAIYTRDNLYTGSHSKLGPDIQFLTRRTYGAYPHGLLADRVINKAYAWSGEHTSEGIFVLKGPGVKHRKIKGISMLDVAPTILYIMGAPIPDDVDGSVLTQIFDRSYVESKPVTYATYKYEYRVLETGLTKEEERAIEERLRSMGYLG